MEDSVWDWSQAFRRLTTTLPSANMAGKLAFSNTRRSPPPRTVVLQHSCSTTSERSACPENEMDPHIALSTRKLQFTKVGTPFWRLIHSPWEGDACVALTRSIH